MPYRVRDAWGDFLFYGIVYIFAATLAIGGSFMLFVGIGAWGSELVPAHTWWRGAPLIAETIRVYMVVYFPELLAGIVVVPAVVVSTKILASGAKKAKRLF